MRLIGKRYEGEAGFARWGDFFENGWFDQIEAAMGGEQRIKELWEDGGGYVGVEFRKEGKLLKYWIGMFAPPGTAVPAGMESLDFGEGCLGVCWNYGKEDEVHDVAGHEEALSRAGMELWKDAQGAVIRFENGLCPRFTTPDGQGNVILDWCYFVRL